MKRTYRVDAYTLSLGKPGERLVHESAYWYGVWGHQRDTFKWKGFLQLDLAPGQDAAAKAMLAATGAGGTA